MKLGKKRMKTAHQLLGLSAVIACLSQGANATLPSGEQPTSGTAPQEQEAFGASSGHTSGHTTCPNPDQPRAVPGFLSLQPDALQKIGYGLDTRSFERWSCSSKQLMKLLTGSLIGSKVALFAKRLSGKDLLAEVRPLSYQRFLAQQSPSRGLKLPHVSNALFLTVASHQELEQFLCSEDAQSFDRLRIYLINPRLEVPLTTWLKFQHLKGLVELDWSFNHLQSEGLTRLSQVLPDTGIRSLNLMGNSVADWRDPAAVEEFTRMLPHTQLSDLNLMFDDLPVAAENALVRAMPRAQVKTALQVHRVVALVRSGIVVASRRGIPLEAELAVLFRGLAALPAFDELSLYNLKGDGLFRPLAQNLVLCPGLKSLSFFEYACSDEVFADFSRALTLLPKLTKLRFAGSSLAIGGVAALVAEFAHLPKLAHLRLDGNRLSTNSLAVLAASLNQLPSLTFLHVWENHLSGTGFRTFFAHLNPTPQLLELALQRGTEEEEDEAEGGVSEKDVLAIFNDRFRDRLPRLRLLDLGVIHPQRSGSLRQATPPPGCTLKFE